MSETFDHIVIGGGASGCVAASRLVTDGNRRVLLLEAGYSHHHPLLDMPPGIFKMINGSKYMTYHHTVPQPHLHDRVHDIPQGNVLGGGTSVNAQVYMRGRPSDYDEWEEILRGNNEGASWGWSTVLKHFRRIEGNNRLSNEFHGSDGPLLVSDPGYVDDVSRWFVQSVQEMGEPFNPDFNGTAQRGVGFYQFMNRAGKRSSAAYAYIEPLKNDKRLTVRLRAAVSRINVENGRAVSVTYTDEKRQEHTVFSKGDIVLSAGALVTPKLLMLSGIGPAAHLEAHGIQTLVDLPGVGQNLIDHPEVPVISVANGPYGYYRQGVGWRMLMNGLHFKLFGSGRILSTGFEAGAFINPIDRDAPPSIQAFCVPIVYLDRDLLKVFDDTYGVTITTVVAKPKSRGYVQLRSADPAAPPLVSPHLLQHADDMATMVAGQRFFRDVLLSGPLGKRVEKVIAPAGPDLSDEAMAEHCRRFVKTNYHPASTARMGADGDPMAVLDARLRVRGIDNLRVSDLSAVPNINAGNTTAPAMMLGDRCVDFILGVEQSMATN
ncbi:glucose-methanol-choline oxidoreductase [Kaistia algarum]|uniref:GMC family oxidoreductase n=1 Tax=Kaistia algarum TaxID=2083279 RepID=UPI000CE8FB44|nr:GMC family oxidoreductase N-terminal domain-containing protein [Kaistia algarum]MCX5514056.1 GMC family oxidoreductase N-terminal domain-containing protein [Kaistia algarum]PPE77279.1 glucose-methanol-choline oxidoreductase [Kaistia algarum]